MYAHEVQCVVLCIGAGLFLPCRVLVACALLLLEAFYFVRIGVCLLRLVWLPCSGALFFSLFACSLGRCCFALCWSGFVWVRFGVVRVSWIGWLCVCLVDCLALESVRVCLFVSCLVVRLVAWLLSR